MTDSNRNRLSPRVCALAALLCLAPAALADDDRAYRAGIGLAIKGLDDLAASELSNYLRESPEGAHARTARYTLAVCCARLGKHAEAARELDLLLDGDLKGFDFAPDALYLRAQCALATDEPAKAAQFLAALLESHPGFGQLGEAAYLRGEALYRAGDAQAARRALEGALQRWPGNPSAARGQLFRAYTLAALDDSPGAAEACEELLKSDRSGAYAPNAALLAAQCRQRLGEFDRARELYDLAGGDASLKPEAMLGAAQIARAQGKAAEAERMLKEIAGMNLPASLLGGVALERGRVLYDQQKFEPASQVFRALADQSPAHADAAEWWQAKCELRTGRAKQAAERLTKAGTAFPKSPFRADMLFDRAGALAQAGDEQGALEAYRLWRAEFPRHALLPDALAAEASCLYRLGRHEESLATCEEFARSGVSGARAAGVMFLTGENYFLLKHFAKAEAAYRAFMDAAPADTSAWRASVRRALCLLELGRAEEGEQLLAAAVSAAESKGGAQQITHDPPLLRSALSALGERATNRKDWVAAERWFATLASRSEKPDADALLRQGLAVRRQNKLEAALPVLQKAGEVGGATPTGLHAAFEAAQVLVELGRPGEAKPLFERVLEAVGSAETDDAAQLAGHSLRHLAAIASKEGRAQDAAQLLARAGRAGAGDDTGFQEGMAWLAAGQYDRAQAAFSTLVEQGGDHALDARAWRAVAMNRSGKHDEAAREIGSLGADASYASPETPATVQYELALALRALGRQDEAVRASEAVLGAPGVPPHLAAHAALDLAQAEVSREKFAEALARLDTCRAAMGKAEAGVLGLVPEHEAYLRAVCLLRTNKPADAAAALAKFGESFPRSELTPAVGLALGDALLQTGRAREAVAALEKVAGSKAPPEIIEAALLKCGEAWAAAAQWTRSEEAYAGVLERFPESERWFQARFGQGWARENQGRHDAAVESYREVVSRHQGVTAARAQFQIGECLYAQRKHAEAVAELVKVDVLYDYPEWSAAALYEAGRCLTELGRVPEARRQFEDVIKRFPESKWAALAKERTPASASAELPGRTPGGAGISR